MKAPTPMTQLKTILAFAALAMTACGRVVGAECIDGYELCGESCCPDGMCSSSGLCLADDGGTPVDGGDVDDADVPLDGDRPTDAGVRDGDTLDGQVVDASFPGDMGSSGCPIGTSRCDDECVNLDTDRENCGACGNDCADDELCQLGVCQETCDDPLILCDGVCVDPDSDPANCNSCGNVCPTGICRPTGCAEADASDVILIGHDYTATSIAQDRLVANGALLRLEEPVRIVMYEGSADASSRASVLAAIADIADEASREYVIIEADAAQVPTRLQRADTFLVLPQHGSETTDSELRSLGREWSTALASFIERGGAIVILDGGGSHSGTWQIAATSSLLDVDGRMSVPMDTVLTTIEPTDAIANEVPVNYAASTRTVAFTGTTEGEVVEEPGGEPVAVHRFIEAP